MRIASSLSVNMAALGLLVKCNAGIKVTSANRASPANEASPGCVIRQPLKTFALCAACRLALSSLQSLVLNFPDWREPAILGTFMDSVLILLFVIIKCQLHVVCGLYLFIPLFSLRSASLFIAKKIESLLSYFEKIAHMSVV